MDNQSNYFVFQNDMMVQIQQEEIYFYPDIGITCEPLQKKANKIVQPILLGEVLSKSTKEYDKNAKFIHYQKLSSLQYYLIVSQDEPIIEVYERPTASQWLYTIYQGIEAQADLPRLKIQLVLNQVYNRISFEDSPEKK